jgi:3-oxoacyl-[acyl-carrier protein] reductase
MNGKVAVVTGGAKGIGAATARLLAQRGAAVVVNYMHSADAAGQVVAEIRQAGGKAIAVQADVRDRAQAEHLVAETVNAFGRVDIMVNNAAMSFVKKSFAEMTWDEFAQKYNDELKAAFHMTQAVLPHMRDQRNGRIIYVSSGLGKHAAPEFIAHGTSKGAINTFAKYIAQEFGPIGITVNVVSPGLVETERTANQPAAWKQRMAATTPLGRIATPEDVAGAIAFFASDDSRFITGDNMPVNGGTAMD